MDLNRTRGGPTLQRAQLPTTVRHRHHRSGSRTTAMDPHRTRGAPTPRSSGPLRWTCIARV
eukprot:3610133-Karenia_brevis.AAC.1